MKVIYESFDGKHFNTATECRKYEVKNSVFFFDHKGKAIDFSRTSSPYFIFLPTTESLESFKAKVRKWSHEWGNSVIKSNNYFVEDFTDFGIYVLAGGGHYYNWNKEDAKSIEKFLDGYNCLCIRAESVDRILSDEKHNPLNPFV